MSDPNMKGVKGSPSTPATRRSSATSSAKSRALTGKSARPKPIVKRSPAEKAPAHKAAKAISASSAKSKAKKSTQPIKPATTAKKTAVAPKKAAAVKSSPVVKAKTPARKPASSPKHDTKIAAKPATKIVSKSKSAAQAKSVKPVANNAKPVTKSSRPAVAVPATKRAPAPQPVAPRQPTRDEAAALRIFEKAHREFVRGRFAEAGSIFRTVVEKHAGASEVAARARTYLAITESRLRRETALPRDADSLYDRGIIELNRGEYVAAQEMFERALKREPEASHIHYGLAATRARLGSIDPALESLQKALDLQPNLRVRAQHDQDLSALRNDPVFEQLIFSPRV